MARLSATTRETVLALSLVLLLVGPAMAGEDGPDADYLPPPLLGPPTHDAYGPGINADATGRPFVYETDHGERLTIEPPPKPNAYGLGVGMDAYGRPVRARPYP